MEIKSKYVDVDKLRLPLMDMVLALAETMLNARAVAAAIRLKRGIGRQDGLVKRPPFYQEDNKNSKIASLIVAKTASRAGKRC
jgi:hypothetical protein